MNLPSQAQVNLALRYASQAAVGAGSLAVFLGALPADTAHQIVVAAQKVITDLQNLVGDSALLLTLAGPVVAFWIGKRGWISASPANQTASAIAADPKGVIAAVNALPAANVTVSDEALASPGVRVVPSGIASKK